jgi:predicted Zn finger-like uncharacterized protein
MSMTTQCPACDTTFRVTPQQLQSQHGMVRCGRCAMVFDGFKALATLAEEAPAEAASRPPPLPEIELPTAEPEPVAAPVEVAAEPELPAVEAPPAEIETAEAAPVEQAAAPEIVEPEAAPIAVVAETPIEAPRAALVEAFATPPAPPPVALPKRRRSLWTAASLVLLLVLAAQLVYFNRGDIAAALPESRATLTEWCKSLQCTVDLPQRPRQISIEASDMQAADATNPDLIILTATLRNQATATLGYPALDVVLTNTREHTVARRIFLPAEYLADNKDWRAGFPPSAEITVRLNIDSGDLGAAGFRLDLMAAPAT